MSTVLGIAQTVPPPRWRSDWVEKLVDTHNGMRRLPTTMSLPALDTTKPDDNRFKPNRAVAVTESRRIGWVPTRRPDANLHSLILHKKYPKIGCHETRFQHALILNKSMKDDAWFKTHVKSEFSSHMTYLKR